ncbi:MAG: hypothetical protein J6L96_02715 [Clostridia bacterium]|nr:hypothetical protein [Clostridia bacterium]
MRSYRIKLNNGGKAKKIIFRILFVLLAAVLITVLTILLGHHLLDKASKLDEEENFTPEDTEPPLPEIPEEYFITSTTAPSVFAVAFDVRDYEDESSMTEKIGELSGHYDTLMLRLDSENGGLIYSSPAKCTLLGLPVSESDPTLDMIKSAIKTAKSKRMRLCAVIPSSHGSSATASASVIDSTLIGELAGFGFDEVMIQLNNEAEFNRKSALELREYLIECDERTLSACLIGVTLPAEYYLEASYAKHLQIIGSSVSFLGINFPTENMKTSTEIFSSVSHDITSLLGSFTVYNMRLVIDGDNIAAAAAEYTASVHSDIKNVCIMGTYLPEEMAYDQNAPVETEETTNETEPPETDVPTNPYASTGDYYGDETTSREPDAPGNEDSDKSDKPWY